MDASTKIAAESDRANDENSIVRDVKSKEQKGEIDKSGKKK